MRSQTTSYRMDVLLWVGVFAAGGVTGCAGARRTNVSPDMAKWEFDDCAAQRCPTGWKLAATNPTAELATWKVVDDPTAPSPPHVLALTKTQNYDGTFNLAIAQGPRFRDLDLTVKVKAVAGQEDQGGGPIWRCQDENNYYICRLNPLEGNFRVYVVSGGKRKQLGSVKVELTAARWCEVTVRMTGNRIVCELDGQSRLEATDDTIPQEGQIGLWTKADAVTSFDDLNVRVLRNKE